MSTPNPQLQQAASTAQIALAALGPLVPFLGPQAMAAAAVATAISNAIANAASAGQDLTEADFQAALAADDAAKVDDLQAQAEAKAQGR